MEMRELLEELQSLELIELEKVKSIVETLIVLKRDIEAISEGNYTTGFVKLQQGKRQPIAMIDENDQIIKEFKGFTACANYIRDELKQRNHQNRLRKALEENEEIEGYRFILLPSIEDNKKTNVNKRKQVLMIDENGEVIEEFRNLRACETYLREELDVKNQRVKLKQAMDNQTELAGYYFVFKE